MTPYVPFESLVAQLPRDDVDTDQIIPARFLKTVTRDGLGRHLFHDWRFDEAGRPRPEAPLAGVTGARVLVAGANFGCGSSREHAPWALLDFGFRAVVARSFADIFYANALKNGLLCIPVGEAALAELRAAGDRPVAVDLARTTVGLAGGVQHSFPIESFARRCLLDGVDPLAFVLRHVNEITHYEETRAWKP